MKIAHYIDGLYAGGAQRMVEQLVRAIPSSLIITRDNTNRFLREKLEGIRTCLTPTTHTGEMLSYLAVEKPDIFHMHWWGTIFPWHDLVHGNFQPGITSASGKRIKVVVTSHTPWSTFRGHADAVIALGDWLARNRVQSSGRTEVIYNGVNLDEFPAKQDFGLSDVPRISFVGRIMYDKFIPSTIEKLRATKGDCVFGIVGDGSLVTRWIGDACPSTRGLEFTAQDDDRFMFHGDVSPEQIPRFMRNSDLMIYASRGEAHCVVILEGMACGLPIIVTPCITMHETITHLHDGIICEVEEMPEWIDKLLADQALREQLGRNARKTCEERFSRERVIREHKQLYESLMKGD